MKLVIARMRTDRERVKVNAFDSEGRRSGYLSLPKADADVLIDRLHIGNAALRPRELIDEVEIEDRRNDA